MPSEIRALGEFVEIKHGFAFSGRHIVSNETKRILLTPGHFEIGGGFRHNHKKYYDSEDYKPGYELEPGELIVSMTDLSKEGDTLGYSAIIPKIDGKILLHNQRIGSVIFKDEKLQLKSSLDTVAQFADLALASFSKPSIKCFWKNPELEFTARWGSLLYTAMSARPERKAIEVPPPLRGSINCLSCLAAAAHQDRGARRLTRA